MSDLPELNLFEEIQGIANSSDFYTYTQDEFNKTWSPNNLVLMVTVNEGHFGSPMPV